MLNENLPHSVLENFLNEYINRIDFLLKEIQPETQIDIINNKQLMGTLHHSLNISNYSKPEFRKQLLSRASRTELLIFLRRVNLIESTSVKDEEIPKLVEKASQLPWGDNDKTKAFVEVFRYEKNLIPKEVKPNPEHEICYSVESPLKILKEYQSKIFFQSLELVENPWTRFIVKMPTGAGKTRTATEIICHFINDRNDEDVKQVVWIADREELCDQAVESMKEIWPHLGKKDLNIYRLWGNRSNEKFENPSFIVATYQKLNSVLKNGQTFPEPHLVISDEAHNVLAPTHQNVLRKLEEHGTRIVGLTATPVRDIDSIENQKLRKYFHEQIIEIDSGDRNAIEYLQGEGYLAHYIPKTIQSERVYRLSSEQRRQIEEEKDLPAGLLDTIAEDDKRNAIIAEQLLKLMEEDSQVLYFAPSVEQSKFMCAILLTMGAKAAHVDGTTPLDYRRDVIAKFKTGEIKFIFNYNVFSTGFDAPNIDVVFIARPTKSIVLHQQMIGRGMRGPKMGGTETFRLYRVVDDMPEIELADEYFSEIWNPEIVKRG